MIRRRVEEAKREPSFKRPGARVQYNYTDGPIPPGTQGTIIGFLPRSYQAQIRWDDESVSNHTPDEYDVVSRGTKVLNEECTESYETEEMMPRKKATRREPTPKEEGQQILADAEKAGANYAQDQVDGSYFRDWVWEQMVEGEEMRKRDPDSVIPLETPSDAKKLARSMLQELEWDTKRDMETHTILELSGAKGVFDSGSADWVRDHYGITYEEVSDAFFSAFDEALESQRQWLTDMILENLDEVRGTPKSKLAHEAKRPTARKSTSSRGTVTYPRSPSGQYVLTRDGKEVMRGTENAIWAWMHRNHSFSVDHAIQYEGYRIAPVEAVTERRRPVVRDYIAVDPRGRTVAGPFTDYNEAKREADRARGYVKLASPHKTREAQGHKSSSAHAALRRATVDDLGIELRHDEDGRYRWYESETGVDTETSGKTILDAIRAARDSWPAPTWNLKFPRSHR